MDTNEIMNNDEVIEKTENSTENRSDIALLAIAGIGVAVIVGGVAYKFLKPMLAKWKAKKNKSVDMSEDIEVDSEEIENQEV